jgi:hypothetical protein
MSKAIWGGLLSFFIGVAVQFSPIPDSWRWGITIAAGVGIAISIIGYFLTRDEKTSATTGVIISGGRISAGRDAVQVVINHPVKSPNTVSNVLLASQIEELNQLQAFIGGKSEGELWELFDLHGITRYNIRRAKAAISGRALTPKDASEIDEFFRNGRAILNARYCKVTRTAGGFHTEQIPGKLGILNLSNKYVTGRQTLARFQSSPQLPSSIQDAVKELDVAIAANVTVLHDVINEKLASNVNHILQEEDGNSPLFGATSGAFLAKRIWLKPKQEAIASTIKAYLNAQ